MKLVTMQDLHAKHTSLQPDELILDVRTPEEFKEGHVPGSKNISHESIANHLDDLKKYKTVYVYCRSGGRATNATYTLGQAGVENILLVGSGGMPDWIQAGFPVEK